MSTGFYNVSPITHSQLRKFIGDAMMLCYGMNIQVLYHEDNKIFGERELTTRYTADMILKRSGRLTVIDRSIYHDMKIPDTDGEIVFVTDDHIFLYVRLTLGNLQKLVSKYHLKML